MTSDELISDLIREEENRFGPMIMSMAEENLELCLIEDEQTQTLVRKPLKNKILSRPLQLRGKRKGLKIKKR